MKKLLLIIPLIIWLGIIFLLGCLVSIMGLLGFIPFTIAHRAGIPSSYIEWLIEPQIGGLVILGNHVNWVVKVTIHKSNK